VEECLSALIAAGLVDDGEFAVAFVRDRVRSRPRGARRLVQELRVRGVADEAAREAVDRVLAAGEVSELDLARKAAEGWARRTLGARSVPGASRHDEDPWAVRRRLHAFLARRGFGGETIRVVSGPAQLTPGGNPG
jgi:regulatory protein